MTATTTSSYATSSAFWQMATSARSLCVSRGREITHQEIGLALLKRMRDDLADLIIVEQFPKLEGRQMIMMIAPGRKPWWLQSLQRKLQRKHSVAGLRQPEPMGDLVGRCIVDCCRSTAETGLAHKWLGANKAGSQFPDASRAQCKKEHYMPKMKTKSAAKKRFRVRPGGTVKRGQAFKRHILTKKTTKNKRHLRVCRSCP